MTIMPIGTNGLFIQSLGMIISADSYPKKNLVICKMYVRH